MDIDEHEAFMLGAMTGQLILLGQKLDPQFNIKVISNLFADDYLSEEFDRGSEVVGAKGATWDEEDGSEVEDEAVQGDLFDQRPNNLPAEDGVYMIHVNGTPGLYSRYVSTMGWSHPTAIRKDLNVSPLPFIGWPEWNWTEVGE